ncbi:MAG: HD domain-containing protein [Treponemataceae bacterium]|nr:HD domain-containing protein [Treponemataceae bacterium]
MADILSTKEKKLQRIIESEKILNEIQDMDVLLERVLTEARGIVHADAGSIFIIEDNLLKIRYAQNDTKQKKLASGQKLPYKYFSFPIDEKSMCGSCAIEKQIVNVADAYSIPPDKKYSFNRQPDILSGYRTQSVMTIPLISSSGNVLGVLQIINAQDENDNIISFDDDAELYLKHFASSAAQALERTYLTREMVFRMVDMAGFRDPKETGHHVNRVASYAVEIYDKWAYNHNIPSEEFNQFRDSLKIAAMLHDVGKVGISDVILRKPGRFTEDEYSVIKGHTFIGASLFKNKQSPLDCMAFDVALHHHEWWDGSGYPGKIDINKIDIYKPLKNQKEGLKGEEIPLSARIVALADVFDALSSKRVYKDAWTEEHVLSEIRKNSGRQFDPEIVDDFFEVFSRIKEIQASMPDA